MTQVFAADGAEYDLHSPDFCAAYAFLKRGDLAELPDGEVRVNDNVRAFVQSYTTTPFEECRFETHDRYFDIQYILEGHELFGVAKRANMKPAGDYSEEKDITFYESPACYSMLYLGQGGYVIVAPEEAHMPHVSDGKPSFVRKIVIKVPARPVDQ